MANRIDSSLSGADSLSAVIAAWLQQFDDDSPEDIALKSFASSLASLSKMPAAANAVKAIACALLNTDLGRHGHLNRINSSGDLIHTYFATDSDRETIVQFLSD